MAPRTKKTKKRKYIPHKAAAEFKPAMDWTIEEAKQEYFTRQFSFEVDKVYYEDCILGLRKLPASSVDMVVADPPFGLNFHEKEVLYNRRKDSLVEGYREVEIENYAQFTENWIKSATRVLKPHGGLWIFSGWNHLKAILNAVDNLGLTTINHIIWKYQFGVFTKRKFVTSHYHIIFAVKHPRKYFFNKIEWYPLDVWDIKRTYQRRTRKNVTKLPTEVVMRCIDFGSKPGDLILDPFMGNGTTAVASKASFRHFLGFEINSSLQTVIEDNLNNIKLGELYVPYAERPDEIVEMARKKFGYTARGKP